MTNRPQGRSETNSRPPIHQPATVRRRSQVGTPQKQTLSPPQTHMRISPFAIRNSQFAIPHGAFTLIEVLLALTLTTLLATLTGRIAVNSFTSRREAMGIVSRIEREAGLVERIEADLASLLPEVAETEPAVLVFGAPKPALQLTVLAADPAAAGCLHTPRLPATVRYRLIRESGREEGFDLIRETVDQTIPRADPVRETVTTRVADFTIEVLHEGQWFDKFPLPEHQEVTLAAIRISCLWLDSPQRLSRTLVVPHGD